MKTTNFDRYLAQQLQAPRFAARFERAGKVWEVALQIAALRKHAARPTAAYRAKRASVK